MKELFAPEETAVIDMSPKLIHPVMAHHLYGKYRRQRLLQHAEVFFVERKVKGTTLPGATVEVKTLYSDLDTSGMDASGIFTFNVEFDKTGDNTITVIALYPEKNLPEWI